MTGAMAARPPSPSSRRRAWLGQLPQLAALLMALQTQPACSDDQTIPLTIKGHTLKVELATTPAAQARGLMYRREMGANHGMLFVYQEPQMVSYWMKNTFLPLSIAFIASDRHIINMADMVPLNETRTYPSYAPCKYVLEVNKGWFEKHGIKEGDKVEFTLPSRQKPKP